MAVKLLNRYNAKIHPLYKMFSWDLLFYYAIIYLFLTLEKGLSASQILLLDAICQFSKFLFQLPCVGFIELLKNRKSLIIANILSALSILLLILSKNFQMIILSNIVFAISYNIKQLCESSILFDTIPKHRSKNKVFTKIDSIGQSYYYYFDAASAILAGFLFIVNNYIPLVFCFACCCISVIIAFNFKETSKESTHEKQKHKINLRNYIKDLLHILNFIFHSKRLRNLVLFAGMFTGLLLYFINLRSIILVEINFKSEYFGVVLAIIQIISAISSKKTNYIHHKLKNKTLAVFSQVNLLPIILIGLGFACKFPYAINLAIISLWIVFFAITKGPFYTLIKRYLQSFSPSEVTTKVYGLQTILSSLFATTFSLLSSLLLNYISVANCLILVGSILSLLFLLLLIHMKNYVGLKPEKYSEKEITYTKLS